MHRRKRNLRLKSITFSFDGLEQQFEFDSNEKLICTKQERENKINYIKLMLNLKPNQTTENNEENKNSVKNENNFDSSKIVLKKTNDGLFIDLTNCTTDDKNDFSLSIKPENKKEKKDEKLSIFDREILSEIENSRNLFPLSDRLQYFIDYDIDDFHINGKSEYFNYLF